MVRLLFTIALTWLLGGLPVWAGTFKVTPVRVELSARQLHSSIVVVNMSGKEQTVQSQVLRWAAKGNDDEYSDTDEVLVNPPIFTMAAGETQIIRLGLRDPKPAPQEISYRLILQELPPVQMSGANVVGTVLRVSLPIFVQPSGNATPQLGWRLTSGKSSGGKKESISTRPELVWRFTSTEEGKAIVYVENQGNVHARIRKVMFFLGDESKPFETRNMNLYVLPGGRRVLQVDNAGLSVRSRLVVKVVAEHGDLRVEVPADGALANPLVD
jgi:fimbrial chaperone protein